MQGCMLRLSKVRCAIAQAWTGETGGRIVRPLNRQTTSTLLSVRDLLVRFFEFSKPENGTIGSRADTGGARYYVPGGNGAHGSGAT